VKLVIGADHAGFPLKEEVRDYLAKAGHEVVDLGLTQATSRTTIRTLLKSGGGDQRGNCAARDSDLRVGRGGVRGGQQDSRDSRGDVS